MLNNNSEFLGGIGMAVGTTKWLIDVCLPRGGYAELDAVHAHDFARIPGPSGLREAQNLGRTLVTCAAEFRGPCSLALDHPGIVVFETPLDSGAEVARNLMHLQFRVQQYDGVIEMRGSRFLIKSDKAVYWISQEGFELELEPWREVRLQITPAFA